jgi:septum site-determining protein MinD
MISKDVFSMGIATVITSGKGGVGKSTAAVGLGRALAGRGRRVLLVDCDAGLRSLDRMTGTEENLVFDSSDVVFGRCAPAEAIYPCAGSQAESGGLFLLPAPASGDDLIRPGVMARLVPLLTRYYDHVLLDSPAGVGLGFRSAACAAERALLVCSPDPVCVRSAGNVRRLLDGLGVEDKRLIINRFNGAFFDETGVYTDLDGVIDASGVQLFGLTPEDITMAAAFLKGQPAPPRSPGMLAMARIAARLEGESVPMPESL